jgi:hypothetical protein
LERIPNHTDSYTGDEFNTDGRSFYPGDDPYWCVSFSLVTLQLTQHREAVDLHYWPTGDLEWYDPGVRTALYAIQEILTFSRQ